MKVININNDIDNTINMIEKHNARKSKQIQKDTHDRVIHYLMNTDTITNLYETYNVKDINYIVDNNINDVKNDSTKCYKQEMYKVLIDNYGKYCINIQSEKIILTDMANIVKTNLVFLQGIEDNINLPLVCFNARFIQLFAKMIDSYTSGRGSLVGPITLLMNKFDLKFDDIFSIDISYAALGYYNLTGLRCDFLPRKFCLLDLVKYLPPISTLTVFKVNNYKIQVLLLEYNRIIGHDNEIVRKYLKNNDNCCEVIDQKDSNKSTDVAELIQLHLKGNSKNKKQLTINDIILVPLNEEQIRMLPNWLKTLRAKKRAESIITQD